MNRCSNDVEPELVCILFNIRIFPTILFQLEYFTDINNEESSFQTREFQIGIIQ